MKKNYFLTNNKAFALAETLIVSTVVAGILIYFFIQFSTLKRNYNKSFKYNNVNDLYALEDVTDYLYTLNKNDIKNYLITTIDEKGYIDITKNSGYNDNIDNYHIFQNNKGTELLDNLNIERLVITSNDISSIDTSNFSPKMQYFMKKIRVENSYKYRLIAQFDGDSYATMVINLGGLR